MVRGWPAILKTKNPVGRKRPEMKQKKLVSGGKDNRRQPEKEGNVPDLEEMKRKKTVIGRKERLHHCHKRKKGSRPFPEGRTRSPDGGGEKVRGRDQ